VFSHKYRMARKWLTSADTIQGRVELLHDLMKISSCCEDTRTLPQIPLQTRVPPVHWPLCCDLVTEFQEPGKTDSLLDPVSKHHQGQKHTKHIPSLEDHVKRNAPTSRKSDDRRAA
jgi:hypothetical protein